MKQGPILPMFMTVSIHAEHGKPLNRMMKVHGSFPQVIGVRLPGNPFDGL